MTNSTPIRITGIDVRNWKAVKLVRMKLDSEDNLITIGGENAQGKSSILDAVENTLTSAAKNLKSHLRNGEKVAQVQITAPPYRIIREVTAEGSPSLRVVHEGEGTVPRPQDFLKELIGGIFVDPVEFLAMQPIKQRETLRQLVGLDLSDLEAEIEEARANEKRLSEQHSRAKANAEGMPFFKDAPESEQSISDLARQLQDSIEHNNGVDNAFQAVEAKRSELRATQNRLDDNDADIARLKRQLAEAEDRSKALAQAASDCKQAIGQLEADAAKLKKIDIAELSAAMEDVDLTNQKVRANVARKKAQEDLAEFVESVSKASEIVKAKESEKRAKLSAAEFPVEGLAFDAQQVTLNGFAFSQASHAEQIRAAVAISLAQRGKLGLVLIRDASTIDKKTLRLIAEECEKQGAQVFAEIVANQEAEGFDRECAFYIVEGEQAGRDGNILKETVSA